MTVASIVATTVYMEMRMPITLQIGPLAREGSELSAAYISCN